MRTDVFALRISVLPHGAHGPWAALRAGRCASPRVRDCPPCQWCVCGVSAPEDRGLWCAVCVAAPVLAQLLRYEDDLALEQYPFRKK